MPPQYVAMDGPSEPAASPHCVPAMPSVLRARPLGAFVTIGRGARLAWGAVGAGGLAVLAVALWLPPDARGHGTHEALGIPPCGFVVTSGLPCPTCGMTTAFSNAVRGRIAQAFVAHPGGLALCLLAMLGVPAAFALAATGRMPWINWDRNAVRLMLGLALVILAGWGFKIIWWLTIERPPG